MTKTTPKVFVSYSHDNDSHKDWVLTLATRLNHNGVNVVLDQWDLTLGSDVSRFMESGLLEADRVLSICTNHYVEKANSGLGGVGYEKMILTPELMKNINSDRIIPVLRDNDRDPPAPTFLSTRKYIDFREDQAYEAKYSELVREIHGEKIKPRPPIGKNPFASVESAIDPVISFSSERYVSPALSGVITFDYSNNDGHYVVGAGDMAFETKWSRGSNTAIHALSDPQSIRSVALAIGVSSFSEIADASAYDTSSRSRTPQLGEIVVWRNSADYYLATKVEKLQSRGHRNPKDEITFSYVIQPTKSPSFLH